MLSIEKNIPLSQSRLWQAQRDFFIKEGINAWQGQVPFFVTSNPFIAKIYAKLIVAYLKDLQISNQIDPDEPIYILELGTGSGQFSYYCLRALQQEIHDINFCYVMTDFTESNITFWEQQAVFKDFSKHLDFAEFDFEHPGPIHLRKQNITLKTLKNPCILIGNYIFDTVRQDYYGMDNGTLIEKRIETFLSAEDYDIKHDHILSLHDAKIEERPIPYMWEVETRETPYLRFYETHLEKGMFSLPVGGFDALDFFNAFSSRGLMLISSDKGYNCLNEMTMRKKPELVTHGSFSLDVNFHALSMYFEFLGGRSYLQPYRDGIKTNVFLSNDMPTPRLTRTYTDMTAGVSPADYFYYHRRFRDEPRFDLASTLSQLSLSAFDPYVFSLFVDKICDACKKTSNKALLEGYCDMIPKLYDHIYPLPKATDHYFNLGLFLHTLTQYQEAIPYYEASLDYYGARFSSLYNLGICSHMTGNYAAAKRCFEQAIPLEEHDENKAKNWLAETLKFCI